MTKQLVQGILKIEFWRMRVAVNAVYVNNMKKLLTAEQQDEMQ